MAKRPSLHGTGREALAAAAAAKTAEAGRPAPVSVPIAIPIAGPPAAAKRPTGPVSGEESTPVRAIAAAKSAAKGTTERTRRSERDAGRAMPEGSGLAWWGSFDWWDGANALARANAALARGAVALCEEMFSFANARLRHNIETGETLRRCKSPTEILETQADYARTATEQYLAEPIKLMDLAAKTTGEGWSSVPWDTQAGWKTAEREGVRS